MTRLDYSALAVAVDLLGLVFLVVAIPAYRFVVGLKLENAGLKGRVEVLERDVATMQLREAKRDENIAQMASGMGEVREVLSRIEGALSILTGGKVGGI